VKAYPGSEQGPVANIAGNFHTARDLEIIKNLKQYLSPSQEKLCCIQLLRREIL
jgi:hypothetical protein